MDFDLWLKFVNFAVMPAWALLILAPGWEWTRKLVHSMLYPLILGGVYIAGMVLAYTGHGADGGSFTSIEGIRTLFSADVGILVGWTHYLVFDLFIGAWESRDARRRGFSHWLLIPCLIFTYMLGPVGLFLYLVLRVMTKNGGWSLFERDPAET